MERGRGFEMMRSVFSAAAGLLIAAQVVIGGPALAHGDRPGAPIPPWQQASAWPDRVVVTFAADPARTLAVSWRTDDTAKATRAEIARATPDARFDLAARSVDAQTERLDPAKIALAGQLFDVPHNAALPAVRYHSALFEGLEPDTLYVYRVQGAADQWSEWFQVRTAPLKGPVTFLYLGDAQNGILSHWSRAIRAAYAKAPDARFIIHAGDMVDTGSRDYEWAQWFKAVGFIHGMVPAVPVAGNHEYSRVSAAPNEQRRALSQLWRPQWRLPQVADLPADLQETAYAVRYTDDLHVFVIDTMGADLKVQAAWLDRELANSKARWRVATFHHPVFSSGRDRDDRMRRDILLPVLKKHDVDLVLQGHDHTYARGGIPQTPERLSAQGSAAGAIGPMFVNSVSGPKQYVWRQEGWKDYAEHGVQLQRKGENSQFFQVIRIDGERLAYEAWTVDGQLYDAFALEKGPGGKRLIAGVAATIDERAFSNTAPYSTLKLD
jgi:3',5'-cyclic AMP phosphodiesterase CpdA